MNTANKETAKKYYEKGVIELINGIQVDLSGALPEERLKALEYQERMKKLLQNTQSRLDDLKSGILFKIENISWHIFLLQLIIIIKFFKNFIILKMWK